MKKKVYKNHTQNGVFSNNIDARTGNVDSKRAKNPADGFRV